MIPISFEKLWRYVHLAENIGRFKSLDTTYKKILNSFDYEYKRASNYRQTMFQFKESNRVEWLSTEKWQDFTAALRIKPLNLAKFIRALVPDNYSVEQVDKLIRNANLGEIEIKDWGDNLLTLEQHGIPASLFEIFVDDVKFLHYTDKRKQKIEVREGKYIRIMPPPKKSGGVVLGIDDVTGLVVLVSQFRHAPEDFLTEAPRGFFALGEDEKPIDAAVRELREETGFEPVRDPIVLKYSYTDSGVLGFKPILCLIFVDKNRPLPNPKLDAAMCVPIWFDLVKFYEAVFSDDWVRLEERHFEEIDYLKGRDTSEWRLPTNNKQLKICDNFTICAAMLAIPYLVRKYKPLKTFLQNHLIGP